MSSIYTITDTEKQMVVEAEFNTIWVHYLGVLDMGLIHSPRVGLHPVKKPQLAFVCKGVRTAGMYYPDIQRVEINTAYVDGIELTHANRTTIAHELAHYLVCTLFPAAKQWHGAEFKHVMASIGYSGDTYHSMSREKAKAVANRVRKGTELFDLG